MRDSFTVSSTQARGFSDQRSEEQYRLQPLHSQSGVGTKGYLFMLRFPVDEESTSEETSSDSDSEVSKRQ